MTKTLYLSLGSNLGDRAAFLEAARTLLQQRLGEEVAFSSLYETRPWGFASDHAFLNAAAAYRTALSPEEALAATQAIEREVGRTEKTGSEGYADRVIDIDLLFFENEDFLSPTLTLPHPHLIRRRFVLAPLAEIAAEVVVPTTGLSVAAHLQALNQGKIEQVTAVNSDVVTALQRLMPQLTTSAPPQTEASLTALIHTPTVQLFLLRDEENQVQACCTLCYAPSPTGTKAWLEDVVVDSSARNRGYGKQLVAHALSEAKRNGAKSLHLTSRPSRIAANRLYQRMGFAARTTNVYAYDLTNQ